MVISKLVNNNDRKLALDYGLDNDHSLQMRGKER
jgi:hypothetical protein